MLCSPPHVLTSLFVVIRSAPFCSFVARPTITAQQQQQHAPPPPRGTPPQPPPRSATTAAAATGTPPAPPKAQPQPRAAVVGTVPTQLGGVLPVQQAALLQRQLLFLNSQQVNPLQQQQQLQMLRSLQLQQLAFQQQTQKVAAALRQQQQQRVAAAAASGTPPPPAAAGTAAAALVAAQQQQRLAAAAGMSVAGTPSVRNVGNLAQLQHQHLQLQAQLQAAQAQAQAQAQSRVSGMAGVARIGKGITAMPTQAGVNAAAYMAATSPPQGNPPPPPSTSLLPSNAVAKSKSAATPIVHSDLQTAPGAKFRAIPALPTPFQNHMSSANTLQAQQQQQQQQVSTSAPADPSRPRILGTTSSPLPRPPIVGATITGRTSASHGGQTSMTPSVASPRVQRQSNAVHKGGVRAVGTISGKSLAHNTRTLQNYSNTNKFTAPAQARANQGTCHVHLWYTYVAYPMW